MGTAERRERERVQRSRQIQEAAKRVFIRQGYHSATIQNIAREAELSIGTIYFYFKTKEEIYASINLGILESYREGLEGIMAETSSGPVKKLERAWELLNSVFCRSQLSLKALAHGQLQGSLQNISRDLIDSLNETGRVILNRIASLFKEGMEKGEFSRANPVALADLFWATFAGVVYWEEAKRTTDPAKNYLQRTLKLAFENLMKGITKDVI